MAPKASDAAAEYLQELMSQASMAQHTMLHIHLQYGKACGNITACRFLATPCEGCVCSRASVSDSELARIEIPAPAEAPIATDEHQEC
jgi:hypothetical protein